MLLDITDQITVETTEISSLEEESWGGGYYQESRGFGTTIVLKNGRKILAKGIKISEIREKLKEAI